VFNKIFFSGTAFLLIAVFWILPVFSAPVVIDPNTVWERSLKHNLEVQIEELNNEEAKAMVGSALSVYDPQLMLDASYGNDRLARSAPFLGTRFNETRASFQLSQATPLGNRFTLGSSILRSESDPQFPILNPFFDQRFYAEFSQSLGRDFFGIASRNRIEISRIRAGATQDATLMRVWSLVGDNLRMLIQTHALEKQSALHRESLAHAQALLESNSRKFKTGLIERPDLAAFEAYRHVTAIQAEDISRMYQETLRLLVQALLLDSSTTLEVRMRSLGTEIKSPDEAVALALKNRPDLRASLDDLKAARLQVVVDKNQRLPRIDLTASMQVNGLSGTWSEALSDTSLDQRAWSTGIGIQFPLLNRDARARTKLSEAQSKRALLKTKQLETSIEREVRNAVLAYEVGLKNLKASRAREEAEKIKWQGETERFAQGRSDADLVIRYSNDYRTSAMATIDSQAQVYVAEVSYLLATAQLESVFLAAVP
jgi:outer membrane protein TolC